MNRENDCEIRNDTCYSEHDTDDGYCKECGNAKPNPYIDEEFPQK